MQEQAWQQHEEFPSPLLSQFVQSCQSCQGLVHCKDKSSPESSFQESGTDLMMMGLLLKIVSKSTSSRLSNPLVKASLCGSWRSGTWFNKFLNRIGMITFEHRHPISPSTIDGLVGLCILNCRKRLSDLCHRLSCRRRPPQWATSRDQDCWLPQHGNLSTRRRALDRRHLNLNWVLTGLLR